MNKRINKVREKNIMPACEKNCAHANNSGNMDVIIVQTWTLWPFARAGNMDVLISRAGKRRCAPERVRVFFFVCAASLSLGLRVWSWGFKVWGLGVYRATLVS